MALIEENIEALPEGKDEDFPVMGQVSMYGFLDKDGKALYTHQYACYAPMFNELYKYCGKMEEAWVNFRLTTTHRNQQKLKFLRNLYEIFKGSFPDAKIIYGPDVCDEGTKGTMLCYLKKDDKPKYLNFMVKIDKNTSALELFLFGCLVRYFVEYQSHMKKDEYKLKDCTSNFAGKAIGYGHVPFMKISEVEKVNAQGKKTWVRSPPTPTNKTMHHIATEMGYRADSPRLYRMWAIILTKAIKEGLIRTEPKALTYNSPCAGLALQKNTDAIIYELAVPFVAKQKELKQARKAKQNKVEDKQDVPAEKEQDE